MIAGVWWACTPFESGHSDVVAATPPPDASPSGDKDAAAAPRFAGCERKLGPATTLHCDDFEGRVVPESAVWAAGGANGATGLLLRSDPDRNSTVLVSRTPDVSATPPAQAFLSMTIERATRVRLAYDSRVVAFADSRHVAKIYFNRGNALPQFQLFEIVGHPAQVNFRQQHNPTNGSKSTFISENATFEGWHHYEIEIDTAQNARVNVTVDGKLGSAPAITDEPIGPSQLVIHLGGEYSSSPEGVELHFDNVVLEYE